MKVSQVSGPNLLFVACDLRQYSGPTHIAYNDIALYTYAACTYGGKWWFVAVME
jgi:hypothetical protein